MKRLLVLLLVIVMCLACFASCDKLPDSVKDKLDPILDKIGIGSDDEPEHEHEFVKVNEKAPTCTEAGVLYFECECGESKEEAGEPATDHNYKVAFNKEATCNSDGFTKYKCTTCGNINMEDHPATGEHVYDESIEASRIIQCSNPTCTSVKVREYNGEYKEKIVYTFEEDDLSRFWKIFEELEAIISAAEDYDPALHGYVEGSELEAEYLVMEAKYEELYDELEFVTCQYQIAQIEYHVNMQSEVAEENLDYISKLRTELVAEFYSFSEPLYDSKYRDYYYVGMTEQEIKAFIFDSNAVANPEYKALVDRNNEIELLFDEIVDPTKGEEVLTLYSEFVQNNNKIAEIMGYGENNYLEYAYENMYDRDYSYQDVQKIADYVKEYISPVYTEMFDNWQILASSGGFTQEDVDEYYYQVSDSFFDTYRSNELLNDYIDLLEFNSNPDKKISFSDEFNKLFENNNLFRGEYEGAYVTYLYGINTPAAYFGPGYDNPFTVVHEFGHYMNGIYNDNMYNQSFDLLEMHSQGNEILYLTFLKDQLPKKAFELCETYNMLVMLDTIVTSLAVDTFEQAVYTNSYSGSGADTIMADGEITYDEYDLLFNSIIEDFGATGYVMPEYWRYVTIHAPCYYVSYSISALSVLQLYPKASVDFDEAVDSYLKLFTYTDTLTDTDEYMTTEDVLAYAGLYSFTDEELYKTIYNYFKPVEE